MSNESTEAVSPRMRLVDVVLAEISENGLQSLTLKSVALRAGCAHSLIAHHFGTKEGLLAACAEKWRAEISSLSVQILGAYHSGSTPTEGARAAVRLALEATRERSHLMRVLLRSVIYGEGLADPVLDTTVPILGNFTQFLCTQFDLTEIRCRAILHQIGIIVTRLAVASDSELQRLYPSESGDSWDTCREEAVTSIVILLAGEAQS